MGAEWCETTLGQLVDFVSGGTPSKDQPEYWGGSIPWVSAKDLKQFRLADTEDHVTDEGAANGTRLVPAHTVLLLVRGMTLLNDVPICITDRAVTFNQDIKALSPKAGIRREYLPYLLLGSRNRLLKLVDLAGHGTGRLNTDELKALNVVLPPEALQAEIAKVLGTIDDRIALNRRTIETLEAISRVMFKSWFVDFDPVRSNAERSKPSLSERVADLFPNSFVESVLGPIPSGWEVQTVGALAEILRDLVHPSDYPTESFHHYSIPAFDGMQMPTSQAGIEIKSSKFVVPEQSVLLSKLNPRIPRVWAPDMPKSPRSICSTEFIVMKARPHASLEFLVGLFQSEPFIRTFSSMVTGTSGSHQRVKVESFSSVAVVVPDSQVMIRFTNTIRPLIQRASLLRKQSATLAEMRDALLPQLTSGKLLVKQLDQNIPEAGLKLVTVDIPGYKDWL